MTPEDDRWHSKEYVQHWLSRVEGQTLENVRRREQFNMVVNLIPFEAEDRIRVLDLGAGWGALLQAVLEGFPHATGISLDGSHEMLSLGRHRLASLGDRVSFVKSDLDDPGWGNAVDGQLSAIVSSRAIHHLVDDRKKALYLEIYGRLVTGGCFINVDHVKRPDEYLQGVFDRVQLSEVRRMAHEMGLEQPTEEMLAAATGPRRGGEHPGLLTEQLLWLEEAGFRAVDVFWKHLRTAVFGGFKLG